MGQDPKPSKSVKARSRQGTEVRSVAGGPARPANTLPLLPHPGHQTQLASSAAHEVEVTIPALHHLLEQISGPHNDGYFKLSLGDEGKTWYLAYKWQHGPWAGHYVMARVERGDLVFAGTLLAEKVIAVRAGYRKPTKDRYEG